jgi:hypothetical protein
VEKSQRVLDMRLVSVIRPSVFAYLKQALHGDLDIFLDNYISKSWLSGS